MKIKYRITNSFDKEQVFILEKLGIEVEVGYDNFYLYEDNIHFAEIEKLVIEWGMGSYPETEFSESDREKAVYLNISPTKIFGYPQPEDAEYEYPFDIYPYLKDVFEIAKTDLEYGVLKGKQIGGFRLKKEPNWGRSSIGSAHWISDFIFAKPEVYQEIFQPLGIKCMPVLEYNTKKELKTVVQLVPQGIAKANLNIKQEQINEIQEVESWGIKKYILFDNDYYPSFDSNPGDFDFFVTQEYFGSGGITNREVIISQKLYRLLKKHKIKGLYYS
ncbi:hypothetical protein, partial [Testudinibacter aquarius]